MLSLDWDSKTKVEVSMILSIDNRWWSQNYMTIACKFGFLLLCGYGIDYVVILIFQNQECLSIPAHLTVFIVSPRQSFPPFLGLGLTQARVWTRDPSVQDDSRSDHSDQPPSATQVTIRVLFPSQAAPPLTGIGSEQLRLWARNPSSSQSESDDQEDQPPSTKKK